MKSEIVSVRDEDETFMAVDAGWKMDSGRMRYSFLVKNDGCTDIHCSVGADEQMHICDPVELHRLLGEVIELARQRGFDLEDKS